MSTNLPVSVWNTELQISHTINFTPKFGILPEETPNETQQTKY
jgi:hypothetical protein